MATVRFTQHLRRFFDDLHEVDVEAPTVADVITQLEKRFPGLRGYIVDERGALRRHVNIFVGQELVRDRERLSDPLQPEAEVFILQALSGG